jgi:pimeloyl-ACP methyl ester carboxylesterase
VSERLERLEITLADGDAPTSVDVVVHAAEGAERTLLCLHGFGDNLHTWQGVRALLEPRGTRVVALDLPGLGRSPLTPDFARFYLRNAVALAGALAARERARDVPLFAMGNSLGGAIALGLAAAERGARRGLDGLLLLAPATPETRIPMFAQLTRSPFYRWSGDLQRHMPPRARRALGALVARATLRMMLAPGTRPPRAWRDSVVESFSRPGCFADVERVARDVLLTLRGKSAAMNDLGASLAGLSTPTIVLHGDRDAVIGRAEMRRLCSTLAAARLVELANVGHCPQIEVPERCAAAFEELSGSA